MNLVRDMKRTSFLLALGAAFVASTSAVFAATPNALLPAANVLKQQSSELTDRDWQLESLGGATVLDAVQPTIRFDSSGRVSGSASCNRYTGSYTLDGDQVSFSPFASTRRACEPDISIQESRYLDALETAERIELSGPYLFIYTTQFDRPLRYVPIAENADAITTIVAFEGSANAVRVFIQGGRTRMNVFNKADRVTWMRGVPVTVEQTPEGRRYVNRMGETSVVVFVPEMGDPVLEINGEIDQ